MKILNAYIIAVANPIFISTAATEVLNEKTKLKKMKGLNNKLKVPATSSLILSYSQPVFNTLLEQQYLEKIDLSNVEVLSEKMRECYGKFDKMVLYRKLFMRRMIKDIFNSNQCYQFINLAAGQDPLSLYIIEQYTSLVPVIFEVDMANMAEKAFIYKQLLPHYHSLYFLECDLTNIIELWEKLLESGYNPELPTTIIFEGLIHFITDESFLKILQLFRTKGRNIVIMDYTLSDEGIPPNELKGHQDCLQLVGKFVEGEFNTHTRAEMISLISELGGEIISLATMQEIEHDTQGFNEMFYQRGEGIEEMISFSI